MLKLKGMNIIQWFVQSSADPSKLALSARALLVAVVPTILAVAPLVGVDPVFAQEWLNQFVDTTEKLVFYVFSAVASGMFLYGMIRKVLLSVKRK